MRILVQMSLIFIFSFLGIQSLAAQNEDYQDLPKYPAWLFEGSLTIFDPINTFGQNVSGSKTGFNLTILRQLNPDSDLYLGLSGYYTRLGSNTQENITNLGEMVDDIANSNVLGFDLTARYYPDLIWKRFEPFTEATIGSRFYYTITKSFFPEFNETTDISSNEVNSSLAYGFGLGTHIVLVDPWAINLKVSYQLANIARYYVENGESNVDPLDNFNLENSSTDWFRYDIGLSYIF